MQEVVIVEAARSAIGRRKGAFAGLQAADLLGAVQKAAADGDLAALQAAIKEAESMDVEGLESFRKVEERLIEEAALIQSLGDAAALAWGARRDGLANDRACASDDAR